MSHSMPNIGVALLQDEQCLLHVKPDKRAALYWMAKKVGLLVAFVVIFFVLLPLYGREQGPQSVFAAIPLLRSWGLVFVVVIVVLLYLWFRAVIQGYDYVVTNQRCILRYGLFSLNTRVIPYSQIADVNERATFLERLFGLRSVRIDSLGTVINNISAGGQSGQGNNTCRLEGITPEQSQQVLTAISGHLVQR